MHFVLLLIKARERYHLECRSMHLMGEHSSDASNSVFRKKIIVRKENNLSSFNCEKKVFRFHQLYFPEHQLLLNQNQIPLKSLHK